MGTDVFALITRWEPMVEAFRSTGSLDFYWDANARQNEIYFAAQAAGKRIDLDALPELLPYAWEHRSTGGRGLIAADCYYDLLRDHLPAPLREPADAFVHMLYPEEPDHTDDLSTDSGTESDACVMYALRPSSVRAALRRFDAVPWTALSRIGERTVLPEMAGNRHMPNYSAFEAVLHQQWAWLSDAAARDHGVVAVISQ
jgi:hypothetical protein